MGIWNCRLVAYGLLVCVLAAGSAQPCSGQVWKKIWTASVAVLAAANVMDAHSSLGRYETNPLLQNAQGRSSPRRMIAVKSVASGGIVLVQFLLMRRNPQQRLEKPAAIVNFAAAVTVGSIAYRNTRVVP